MKEIDFKNSLVDVERLKDLYRIEEIIFSRHDNITVCKIKAHFMLDLVLFKCNNNNCPTVATFTGISKCNQSDEFDASKGKSIAYQRALFKLFARLTKMVHRTIGETKNICEALTKLSPELVNKVTIGLVKGYGEYL